MLALPASSLRDNRLLGDAVASPPGPLESCEAASSESLRSVATTTAETDTGGEGNGGIKPSAQKSAV